MKRMRTDGFLVVGVLLVVVIVTIGVGGWYVWQKNKDSGATNTNSQTNQSNNMVTSNEKDKYLVINEWGIRATLPEHLRGDISYSINDQAQRDFGGPIRVDFLSKKFSAGDLKCSVVEENNPRTLTTIYREKVGEGVTQDSPTAFKNIGDSSYFFSTTACTEVIEKAGSSQDKQLLADLKNAIINTLESN